MTEEAIARQLALLKKLHPEMKWRLTMLVDTGRDAGHGSYTGELRSRDHDGIAILIRGGPVGGGLWEAYAVDLDRNRLRNTPSTNASSALEAFDRLGRAYLETARALAYLADVASVLPANTSN